MPQGYAERQGRNSRCVRNSIHGYGDGDNHPGIFFTFFISLIFSIKKPEEPERDFAANPVLDAVGGGECVLDRRLVLAADLEKVFPVHEEVAALRVRHAVNVGDLVHEKRLAQASDVRLAAGKHGREVGVVEEHLVRLCEAAYPLAVLQTRPIRLRVKSTPTESILLNDFSKSASISIAHPTKQFSLIPA